MEDTRPTIDRQPNRFSLYSIERLLNVSRDVVRRPSIGDIQDVVGPRGKPEGGAIDFSVHARVRELKSKLNCQQSFFTRAHKESENSVRVSYMIAEKFAKRKKPFAG
ncbi:homeobox protein ARX [Trichonephila clavipes]|nr:homeobox protein ARX [Trichonephila clavipes]